MWGRLILAVAIGSIAYWQRDKLSSLFRRRPPLTPDPSSKAPAGEGSAYEHKPNVLYEVVAHDGGFACKASGAFSETFPSEAEAIAAAAQAAMRQSIPGSQEEIEYQDDQGEWHHEIADGDDRPAAEVRPNQLSARRGGSECTP